MGNNNPSTKKNNFLDKIELTDTYSNFTLNMTKLIKNKNIDWSFDIHNRTDEELNIYEGVIKNFIFYSTDYIYKHSKKKTDKEKKNNYDEIFLRIRNFICILNKIFLYYYNRQDKFFEFYEILWKMCNNNVFFNFEEGRIDDIRGSIDEMVKNGGSYDLDEDIRKIENEDNSKSENDDNSKSENIEDIDINIDKIKKNEQIENHEKKPENLKNKKPIKFNPPGFSAPLKRDKSLINKKINIILKLLITLDRLLTKTKFSITSENINWSLTKVSTKIQKNRKAILELIIILIKLEQKYISQKQIVNNSIISFFKFNTNYIYLIKSFLNNALVKYNKKNNNLSTLIYKEYYLNENEIVILILNFSLLLIKNNTLFFYKEISDCEKNKKKFRNLYIVKSYLKRHNYFLSDLEEVGNDVNIVNNKDIIILIVNILDNIFRKENIIPDLLIKNEPILEILTTLYIIIQNNENFLEVLIEKKKMIIFCEIILLIIDNYFQKKTINKEFFVITCILVLLSSKTKFNNFINQNNPSNLKLKISNIYIGNFSDYFISILVKIIKRKYKYIKNFSIIESFYSILSNLSIFTQNLNLRASEIFFDDLNKIENYKSFIHQIYYYKISLFFLNILDNIFSHNFKNNEKLLFVYLRNLEVIDRLIIFGEDKTKISKILFENKLEIFKIDPNETNPKIENKITLDLNDEEIKFLDNVYLGIQALKKNFRFENLKFINSIFKKKIKDMNDDFFYDDSKLKNFIKDFKHIYHQFFVYENVNINKLNFKDEKFIFKFESIILEHFYFQTAYLEN